MSLDTDKKLEIYRNAPEAIRELYASDFTTETIGRAATSMELQEPTYGDFVEIVGDFILGIHNRKDVPQLFRDQLQWGAQQIIVAESHLRPLFDEVIKLQKSNPHKESTITPNEQSSISITASPPPQAPAPEKPIDRQPLPPTGLPTFITKVDTPPIKAEVAPKETPKVETPHSNVKPLRTFAQDVELSRAHSYGAFRSNAPQAEDEDDEPVHSSSQDDIMKK